MTENLPDAPQPLFRMKPTGLNARQESFCQHYIATAFNGTQAAILAGYSEASAGAIATQLLRKLLIRARIDELRGAVVEKIQLTQEYVLASIIDTHERCKAQITPVVDMAGKPVVTLDEEGKLATVYTFDSKGALKAEELMARYLKMLTDKVELSGQVGTTVIWENGITPTLPPGVSPAALPAPDAGND